MVFRSKKGPISTILSWSLIIGSVVLLIAVHLNLGGISNELSSSDKILLTVICILFSLFVLVGWFHTFYVVTEKVLKVKGGIFNWTIPIEDIEVIAESKNPLSAPALSLDRLQITYGKSKFILISPKDKALFLNHLRKLKPDIIIDTKR